MVNTQYASLKLHSSSPATKDRREKYWSNTALVIDCPADSQASTIADGAIQIFFSFHKYFHLTPPSALSMGTDFGVNMLTAFTLSALARLVASKARRTHGTEYRTGSCVSALVKATVGASDDPWYIWKLDISKKKWGYRYFGLALWSHYIHMCFFTFNMFFRHTSKK